MRNNLPTPNGPVSRWCDLLPGYGRYDVVTDPQVEIEAVCEVHRGSGRLVLRREGDRMVPDASADHCCVIAVDGSPGMSG